MTTLLYVIVRTTCKLLVDEKLNKSVDSWVVKVACTQSYYQHTSPKQDLFSKIQ